MKRFLSKNSRGFQQGTDKVTSVAIHSLSPEELQAFDTEPVDLTLLIVPVYLIAMQIIGVIEIFLRY